MAESDFSWKKVLVFLIAGLALFFGFVNGGSGGILISSGNVFNGIVTLISAAGWIAIAVCVYLWYQKQYRKGK